MEVQVEPTVVNGTAYYTVSQFAFLIKRSEKCVYGLIRNGNALRHLRVERLFNKPLIPVSELTEFPFTGSGRFPLDDIYHYTADGSETVSVPFSKIIETRNYEKEKLHEQANHPITVRFGKMVPELSSLVEGKSLHRSEEHAEPSMDNAKRGDSKGN